MLCTMNHLKLIEITILIHVKSYIDARDNYPFASFSQRLAIGVSDLVSEFLIIYR